MKAEEIFSSLRKTTESKFITEAEAQKQEEVVPVPVEVVDNRPLYIRIAETQKIRDDYFDNLFKLSNRVHKIDEDEMVYYNKLEKDRLEKEKFIKQNEKEELKKFKADAQNLVQDYQQISTPSAGDSKPTHIKKRKDPQKDVLASIVIKNVKKQKFDAEGTVFKESSPLPQKKNLVTYASSSEDE